MANMGAKVATQANGTKGEYDVHVGENDVPRAEVPNSCLVWADFWSRDLKEQATNMDAAKRVKMPVVRRTKIDQDKDRIIETPIRTQLWK